MDITVPKELKKQLALAVASIHWSYGIFWSISATQPGVLEWGDGYYNGDIKTRKTVQAMEFNADQMALQRSVQLRELYESLSAGDSSGLTKRPSAALSPEDLTDTEWYYLVCMSFVFDVGQGMPGTTLATAEPIWLCDAGYDGSKVFTRTLLARSASIQTVVCFPFLGGVIELGVTDLVSEDPSLIHHVKASFLEISYPNFDTKLIPIMGDLAMVSPTTSSNALVPKQPAEESFMILEENFSDCVSQTFAQPLTEVSVLLCNDEHHKANDDLHYQSLLFQLIKSPNQLNFGRRFQKGKSGSSFEAWKKIGLVRFEKPSSGTQQRVLKRVLFEVPRMQYDIVGSPQKCGTRHVFRPEANEIGSKHMLSERNRREIINERFCILKSMVPSMDKAVPKTNKVSVLDETIEYLKELEQRVEELESCSEQIEIGSKSRQKSVGTAERTSDNYGDGFWNRTLPNKRKAHDIEETEPPDIDVSDNLVVRVDEKEVVIEMKCGWREGLLLEIVTAIGNLRLDSQSVQTSTADGVLSVTIKSNKKFAGSLVPSAGIIKQALQRFVHC